MNDKLSRMKNVDLTIIFITSQPASVPKEAYHSFSQNLSHLNIQLVVASINKENPDYRLSAHLNYTLKKTFLGSKLVAITNLHPNIKIKKLEKLLNTLKNNPKKIVYNADFEKQISLKNQAYFIAFKSQIWEDVGGFCFYLQHPSNIFNEFIERAHSYNVLRMPFPILDLNNRFDHIPSKPNPELIRQDDYFLQRLFNSCNYLHKKSPDFLIIGAQKSSSTTLINALGHHPEVYFPTLKKNNHITNEIGFFSTYFYREYGLIWYESLFYHPEKKVAGEKTPEYISDFEAHKRIHKHYPNIKLIASLRNPIRRAWSELQHIRSKDLETDLAFLKKISAPEAFHKLCMKYPDHSILKKGCYIEQIEHLYKYFKKEQLYLIIHEHLDQKHDQIYKDIFEYIGVDSNIKIEKVHLHKGGYKEDMLKESHQFLKEYYQPYNKKLFDLLGYEIGEWI